MEKTDSDILQEVIGEWRTLSRILAIQKHDPTTSYIIGARLYHITKAIDKIFVNPGPIIIYAVLSVKNLDCPSMIPI